MPTVFCFGNELIEGDEIAPELGRAIKSHGRFAFVIAQSPSAVLEREGELWIMDVVEGLPKVALINNPADLELAKTLTCHDLDLGFYLKLLQATGKITQVKIIGLPFGHTDLKKLEKAVLALLDSV